MVGGIVAVLILTVAAECWRRRRARGQRMRAAKVGVDVEKDGPAVRMGIGGEKAEAVAERAESDVVNEPQKSAPAEKSPVDDEAAKELVRRRLQKRRARLDRQSSERKHEQEMAAASK